MDSYSALMIGQKAPAFKANTTYGMINFPDDYKGKWVILFSHPNDFTPVCTTEIMTFASMEQDFKKLNCQLLGLSVDSNPSHMDWCKTMEKYQWKNIKNPVIGFPIIADDMGVVAKMYGMLMPAASATKTVRTVFFIDPDGTVRAFLAYPLTTGRNMKEILRLLTALQEYDRTGRPTPADWMPGEPAILPPPQTLPEVNKRIEEGKSAGDNFIDWYLTFSSAPAAMKNEPMKMEGDLKMMPKAPAAQTAVPQNITASAPRMAAPIMTPIPKMAAAPNVTSQAQGAYAPQIMNVPEMLGRTMNTTEYKSRYNTAKTPKSAPQSRKMPSGGGIMEQNQLLMGGGYSTDEKADYMLTRDYPNMGE